MLINEILVYSASVWLQSLFHVFESKYVLQLRSLGSLNVHRYNYTFRLIVDLDAVMENNGESL